MLNTTIRFSRTNSQYTYICIDNVKHDHTVK